MADVEARRLEREEKRRKRRERIRRILEDDETPSKQSTHDKGTAPPRGERSPVTSRKARGSDTSSSSNRTHSKQEVEKSSDRSTRSTRSTRDVATHTTRSTRDVGTPTSQSAKDLVTPTVTTGDVSSSLSSIRARREARRRRNQEHDSIQNKVTLENGDVYDVGTPRNHSTIKGDCSGTVDQVDKSKDHFRIKSDEAQTIAQGKDSQDHSRVKGDSSGDVGQVEESSDHVKIKGDRNGDVGHGKKSRNHSRMTGNVFQAAADRRRNRAKDTLRSNIPAEEKLEEGTIRKTRGHADDDEESKEKGSTMLDTSEIVYKSIEGEHLGESAEKLEETKKEDTDLNGLDKVQSRENELCITDFEKDGKTESEETRTVKVGPKVREEEKEDKLEESKVDAEAVGKEVSENGEDGVEVSSRHHEPKMAPSVEQSDIKHNKTLTDAEDLSKVDRRKKKELGEETTAKFETPESDHSVTSEVSAAINEDTDVTINSSEVNKSSQALEESLDVEEKSKPCPEKEETMSDLPEKSEVDKEDGYSGVSKSLHEGEEDSSKGVTEGELIEDSPDGNLSSETAAVEGSTVDESSKDNKEKDDGTAKETSSEASEVSNDSKESRTKSEKSSRVSKLKVSDDSWKKNARKKRGVADKDRFVELTVLSRTGKIKDKMKTCETRELETADPWKKEVKKGPRKHKSLDEDAEKELKELSKKGDLKGRVQSCEEKDKESADAWKREVKKTVRKHKSLDEDTENELRELSKTSLLKSRVKECEEKDKESADAFKREVKKDARKHKSLDEETEKELRELSRTSPLKSRIKECEEKDKQSADSWKEVKKSDQPKIPEEVDTSEELKEFAGSGRLKNLIASCAERDEKREESWKIAKEKKKSLSEEEEAELKELSNLKEMKSKIIQSYEERDKESGESLKKQIKPEEGKKSFDETTDEELKELSKTVDVKTRIQAQIEEQEKPREEPKRADLVGDEELEEINLKGRFEAFKQDHELLGTEGEKRDRKETSDHKGDKRGVQSTSDKEKEVSDKSGKSVTKRDTKERRSPTKGDTSGRKSPSKDVSHHGRISPTKRNTSGRKSPTKSDKQGVGTTVPKRDTKDGKVASATDNVQGKTKLDSIRSNLLDGPKSKIKSKRESLDRVSKTVGIKDKIAACKERDKMAPRRLPAEKTTPKPKPKAVPDSSTPFPGTAKVERGSTGATGDNDAVPVNHVGDQFMTIEEEMKDASIKDALLFWQQPGTERETSGVAEAQDDQDEDVNVDIKGKMTYWESPKKDEGQTAGDERPSKSPMKPAAVVLSNVKQGWQKKSRKVNVEKFIKELLSANCRRRELKDIQEVKSDTKKYLAVKKGEEKVRGHSVGDDDFEKAKDVEKTVEKKNKKNSEKASVEPIKDKIDEDYSFDDVVNPNEVTQLRDFSNFRRQVRPANRRAAKSNPVRKLQQREDIKTASDLFDEASDEDEEDAPKPTAIGRLGRPIEPGDRKSKDINNFALDALAGLSAKEDVSKITLKKTSKSKAGVSQEKSEHDGTAPVMLIQIKGHRHMQTRLVEPSVESLNSADAFLLITERQISVWLGKDANVMKKSKASELSNKILQYKLLNCTAHVVTTIKDGGVNIETGLNRSFWTLLGGKKQVKSSKQAPKDGDYEKAVVSTNTVYEVNTNDGEAKLEELSELCGKTPSIKMLDSNKAFVFDFGTEVYAWLGRTCDKTARVKAVELAQDVFKRPFKVKNSLNPITPNAPNDGQGKLREVKRPSWAVFGRMTERAETILFEQKFLDWPDAAMKAKLDKQKDLLNKNLSSGYAKRKAKMMSEEVQLIELVPYDGAKMAEKPPQVKMILEGMNVGRGRGSYDEIERRGLEIITNTVTVYHSSDKEYRQLEEKEWGHFYSTESYVIRWSYSVKASGIRSLKGGESKRESQGRDQIAYFFWHGRDCSASGKGTSALATIELDSDKSPQIMVDQGCEPACFLSMFDGQIIVHHGKPDDAKSLEDDNVLMYCVEHEDEREVSLLQIEARSSNLRSRSSFLIVVIGESIGICIWHGIQSTKEKKQGALRGAKRLTVWFKNIFEIKKTDIVELEEGSESSLFWEALDGKSDYGSFAQSDRKPNYHVRLFNFTSTEGPFMAKEVLDPTRGDLLSPYPFKQSELYDASQPALFLVDAEHEMYLWQGWWPVNAEESDSATTTGSADFRWHRDRRLAMQTIQSYADVVGRAMSKSYVVNAGLEPVEFRAYFPFWEDQPDVTRINLESGKVDGEKASLLDLLAKLSRDRYTLAELRVRPLPEGVDPSKMEMYLSDEEFKEVFNMNKDEFSKLPKWKKLEQRKKAGLF